MMDQPAFALHEAYLRGDLGAVRRELGDPDDFPNTRDECGTSCLTHALFYAPLDSNHADQAARVALRRAGVNR